MESGGVEQMDLLRLNQTDDHNNTMWGVAIEYQLRRTYQTAHWLCNRKWWWAICNWSVCVCVCVSLLPTTSLWSVPKL